MNNVQAKRALQRIIPLILILIFFSQGMRHARHASITFDEGPHLAVGYATLRTGDFRLQPVHIHPPLANIIAAIPVSIQRDLSDPRTIDGWGINSLSAVTDTLIWQYPHPRRIALAGRLPILGLGVLLVTLAFRWAKDRGGIIAGLVAMSFLVLDPNMIAHSSLITTDIAAVTLILLTLYLTDRWVLRESPAPINKRRDGPCSVDQSLCVDPSPGRQQLAASQSLAGIKDPLEEAHIGNAFADAHHSCHRTDDMGRLRS